MTLKEIKEIADELDWVEPSHGLALIAIIDELDEIVDHHLYRGEYDEIIARGLGPLT